MVSTAHITGFFFTSTLRPAPSGTTEDGYLVYLAVQRAVLRSWAGGFINREKRQPREDTFGLSLIASRFGSCSAVRFQLSAVCFLFFGGVLPRCTKLRYDATGTIETFTFSRCVPYQRAALKRGRKRKTS